MRSWTGAMPVDAGGALRALRARCTLRPLWSGWPRRPGLRLTDVAHRWLTARSGQETAQRRYGATEVLSANYTCHLVSPLS